MPVNLAIMHVVVAFTVYRYYRGTYTAKPGAFL